MPTVGILTLSRYPFINWVHRVNMLYSLAEFFGSESTKTPLIEVKFSVGPGLWRQATAWSKRSAIHPQG